METISEQIQGPEIVTEMEDLEIVAGAITNGSQAIAHDGFDVETFGQAADDYARLARTLEETAGAIHTGPALLRDLFWSFHKRAPRIEPVAPLSPAHEINREIVEQILSTTEWREMRESGTVGDPLSSAMATIGCAASAVASLDKETIRYLNQLHELAGEVEQLFAHAEALDELAALSPDEEWSNQLKGEASEARADAAKKEKKAERLNRSAGWTVAEATTDRRRLRSLHAHRASAAEDSRQTSARRDHLDHCGL
jgi:hypothetical protein